MNKVAQNCGTRVAIEMRKEEKKTRPRNKKTKIRIFFSYLNF